MENNIKKVGRPQTPETREKISNSQRMRFAKLNRALKENEIRKLELKNPNDNVPLDDYELFLELRFQVTDEVNLLIDALFQLFRHQLKMEAMELKKESMRKMLAKVNTEAIVDTAIKDYFDKNLIKNENN
ncbi:MAG: hypothetical protein IJ413_09180 [Bacteroides sp.]|nr:hypothetical protein [Bacteroides sp.]